MTRRRRNTRTLDTQGVKRRRQPASPKPLTDRELIRQAARNARDHEWRTTNRGMSAAEVQLRADVEAQRAARRARRSQP